MLTTFQSCHTTLPISFLVSLLPYPHTALIQAAPLNLSGLSWWLRVKNLPATAGDSGLIPGSGRFPGEEGNDNPLQYSYLGNLMTRGTCQAAVCGVAKIRTRLSNWAPTRVCERAHTHTHAHAHTPFTLSKTAFENKGNSYCNHCLGSFDSPTTCYWLFATQSFFSIPSYSCLESRSSWLFQPSLLQILIFEIFLFSFVFAYKPTTAFLGQLFPIRPSQLQQVTTNMHSWCVFYLLC